MQDNITNVFEEEINLLHLAEKGASRISNGDDDEDEEEMDDVASLSPATRGAIHEKRVCDLAARMTLAVMSGVLPQSFVQTLQRHKGKLGQSYDKIILELGAEKREKPVKKSEAVVQDTIEVADDNQNMRDVEMDS